MGSFVFDPLTELGNALTKQHPAGRIKNASLFS